MATHSDGRIMPGAVNMVQPADPRLHQINNAICNCADTIRDRVRDLNLKADAIVGHTRAGGALGDTGVSPAPVANGALEQIEMSLASLNGAIGELADAERRFGGLA